MTLHPIFAAVVAAMLTTTAALPARADGHIDRTDPDATAAAVIKAFLKEDGPAVAALFNEINQRAVPQFMTLAPGDPEWDDLWSDWRQAGLDAFDGSILPARLSAEDGTEAVIPFAYDGESGATSIREGCPDSCRYLVIVLTLDDYDDTTWGFEDINGFPVGRYQNADPVN